MRCDFCGKFRSADDLALIDYSPDAEGSQEDFVFECRHCMSKVDLERHFPQAATAPAQTKGE
jgi:hypothetical protein